MVPLRIAVLTNAFPPRQTGGAARVVAVQVEMLKQAGHEVHVWSPDIPWLNTSPLHRLWCHLKDLRAKPELVTDILAWKPDILFTHNLTGCGFGTPKAIQKTGVRWIHMLHDIQLFEPSGQLYRLRPLTFWQLGWAFLRFHAFGRPQVVISPTYWLLEQHTIRFLLTHLHHHADIETHYLPNPGPPLEPISRAIHTPLRLLFVGHLTRAKGSRMLLEIMRTIRIPCELHIVGDGPDREKLAKAGLPIIFHGQQEPAGVMQAMREADILLVPSQIHENQPTVILEAASVNLPVIAARRGGILETMGKARAEMMCGHNNTQAWCQAIERLTDPEVYAHASRMIQHIGEEHAPDVYAQRFVPLFTPNR